MRAWGAGKAESGGKRQSRKLFLPVMITLIIMASFLCACGGVQPDLTGYEDMPILIRGLAEEDFEITPAELAEMECVSGSGTGESDKAGTVDGYGPTLDSFLAEYGKQRSDFNKIRFIGKDGYKKTLWGEMLEKNEIVLSISNGEEPLKEIETPLRLLIPGAESSYWVYGVTEIEFINET